MTNAIPVQNFINSMSDDTPYVYRNVEGAEQNIVSTSMTLGRAMFIIGCDSIIEDYFIKNKKMNKARSVFFEISKNDKSSCTYIEDMKTLNELSAKYGIGISNNIRNVELNITNSIMSNNGNNYITHDQMMIKQNIAKIAMNIEQYSDQSISNIITDINIGFPEFIALKISSKIKLLKEISLCKSINYEVTPDLEYSITEKGVSDLNTPSNADYLSSYMRGVFVDNMPHNNQPGFFNGAQPMYGGRTPGFNPNFNPNQNMGQNMGQNQFGNHSGYGFGMRSNFMHDASK